MKKTIIAVLIATLLLLSRGLSLAWSAPGHMIIAAIAYRDLSPQERSIVDEILTHHPDYAEWKDQYSTNSGLDLNTFIFMRSSTWPDEIRRSGSPYDHPLWHYIDYPLEPPEFPDIGSPYPKNDILYGIGQCQQTLEDESSPPELRAVYLSWLIHLVGDIHQPLHCATLVNDDYPAPAGDKGGNAFFVKAGEDGDGVNLHSVWDKGLGATVNPRVQYNNAIQIAATYPRASLTELSANKTPVIWSKESRMFAIHWAYLDGQLQGGKDPDSAQTLPGDYTKNLKAIALKRAALAGYRLAVMNQTIRGDTVKNLEPPDSIHLNAAHGWLELGNHLEANEELEEISPEMRAHPTVLDMRYQIYIRAKKWDMAVGVAEALLRVLPVESEARSNAWVKLAYAVRRKTWNGVIQAHEILVAVESKYPKDYLMPFNLACYCSQLHRFEEAEKWLKKAMAIDSKTVQVLAIEDEDLKPLWDSMGGTLWKRE